MIERQRVEEITLSTFKMRWRDGGKWTAGEHMVLALADDTSKGPKLAKIRKEV